MKLNQLNETLIKDFSGNTIFQRGKSYYKNEAVESFEFDADEHAIEATVSGQYGDYQVEISENGTEIDAYCDCPYDGYPCKHIVAVLLYFLYEKKTYQKEQQHKESELQSLKKGLLQYPQTKLVEFLLNAVKKYPDLRRDLLLQIEPDSKITLQTILKQIDKIKLHYDYDGYDNKLSESSRELRKLLNSLKNSQQTIQVLAYWRIADKVLAFLEEYAPDDENIEQIAIDALDELAEVITEKDNLLKQDVIKKLINYYFEDRTGLSDFCFETIERLCSTKEEYLALADRLSKSSKSFYQKQAAEFYKKAGNTQAQYETLSKKLEYGMDYWALAQYWLEQNNFAQALETVKLGIEKGEGRKDELYDFLSDFYKKQQNYSALLELLEKVIAAEKERAYDLLNNKIYKILADYYQSQKNYDALKNLVYLLLQIPRKLSLEIYQYAEKLLKADDFKDFSQQMLDYLIAQKPNQWQLGISDSERTLAKIYFYQQNLSLLHEVCKKHIALLEEYELVLVKQFLSTYLEVYKKEIKRLIDGRGRESYQKAVYYLKRLKEIYNKNKLDIKEWQFYLDNIKEENKRLVALKDELKRAGL